MIMMMSGEIKCIVFVLIGACTLVRMNMVCFKIYIELFGSLIDRYETDLKSVSIVAHFFHEHWSTILYEENFQ